MFRIEPLKVRATAFVLVGLLTACSSASTPDPAPSQTEMPTASESIATAEASGTPAPTPALGAAPTGPTQTATVTDVVDGDTIKVSVAGVVYTVRYIGVDTPETVHPTEPVGWMGPEASAANRDLVEGRTVILERDVSEIDQFDRLLRYVWLPPEETGGTWLLVNLELLRLGFAQVSTYPPDVKYVDLLYLPAQRQAREAGVGLWGATPTPASTAVPPAGNCDPAYPGVCIPPPPPDLDCGEISLRRFEVLPPDPHGFDGDHNGIGCES